MKRMFDSLKIYFISSVTDIIDLPSLRIGHPGERQKRKGRKRNHGKKGS